MSAGSARGPPRGGGTPSPQPGPAPQCSRGRPSLSVTGDGGRWSRGQASVVARFPFCSVRVRQKQTQSLTSLTYR